MTNRFALLPFFLIVVPLVFYIFLVQLHYWTTIIVPTTTMGMITYNTDEIAITAEDSIQNGPIIFVGDVLLARNVEFLMRTKDHEYPFKNLPKIFGTHSSAIVGNFESAILEQHKKTPSYNTTFSVDTQFLPILKKAGFTHVSLANNHSFDYGSSTFAHTRSTLTEVGVTPFGQPAEVDSLSSVVVRTGATTVGILALNQVPVSADDEAIKNSVEKLSSTTDYQIVYVHWGEEYMLKHNDTQEILARKLIDAGADAIIGQHPHVVQDIDVYKDKPIFYSLGNFIFDQYFSFDVEQSLVLSLSFVNETVEYDLTPVTSENTNSQPALMDEASTKLFLANLARRSNKNYIDSIKQGKLILPFSLATYP